ncbi:PREDICTED: putative disease resistance protein RGA1 [Prunus mume]|uniref:Disease resistance protein RGA1 n=1 Tax=Prunus mume TaxID=102107 RepID=A0ABM1LQF3_PRUMU|nr:PREDICTED: putative disease resistance protein RGA1 [Prunus mume]
MAEGVLFNVAEGIIGRLGSLVFQEIALLWGVKDDLQKLKDKVAQLQAVLLDAEQKQANYQVKVWLQSVEDAVYEADDVLDEFYTEAQWRQMVPGNNKVSKQVRIFFSSSNQLVFGLKIGHKIKDLNKRLYEIASNRTFGQLQVNHEDARFVIRERVTHSFVREDNIIGRDEDKRAIIQLLLHPISTENTENAENVSTISIVGFGGMGKTALAQLVFNDEEVQKHFEPKMWTCVSNSFQLDILVKKILKTDMFDMDQLQNELRKKIDGKRYLLVLDDVWNDNREKWLALKDLLMGGARGSKILITTRIDTVAKITNTAKPYKLKGLNEEQSWSLFKKMAFQDGKEPTSSTIKVIGEEIARKCKGVPLAIRTIGRMLYTRDPETEWPTFNNNKLSTIRQEENDILPTLQLSYDVLPSHLKHCFAYCSLFPPDYEIPIENLIKLWVAQGFVKSSNPNECLEDVGYEYCNELVWRSFFQEEEKDEFGIIKSCKMHDLMNELAVKVAGEGSIIIGRNKTDFDAKLLLHVSFDFCVDLWKLKIPKSLLESNKLRTFLFLRQVWWGKSFHKSFCVTIASNFKSLRTLSLNGLKIKKLPKCLWTMIHLRYLDLSDNREMERLPNWIVKLQNLEVLDLSRCDSLVELPRDIKKLINLRHLILKRCYKLAWIPHGLGELTRLCTLSRFVLSENKSMLRDCAGLSELGKLKNLRGELEIENLRYKKDMVSELNYDGAVLKEKRHLYSLTLHWMHIERENSDAVEEESDVIIKSMEALQPHSSLKELTLKYYMGVGFASWFHSLTNIINLKLSDCDRCQHLPPLDHLPFLKSLKLFGLRNLEHISAEDTVKDFASDEMMMMMSVASPLTTFFASLESLYLIDCPNLKGWWRNETASASASSFPCLSTLYIRNCPNLTSMPLYPNLDKLWLEGSSWKVLPSSFVLSKLKSLNIRGVDDIEYLPEEWIGNLTLLQELEFHHCPNLASLPEGIGNLTLLQDLIIKDCPNLASLPEGFRCLASLKSLIIDSCPILEQRCQKETGEDWSKIAHIPEFIIDSLFIFFMIMNIKSWVYEDGVSTKKAYGLIVIVQQQATKNVRREEETDGVKKANSHHSNGPCRSTGKLQECRKSVVRSVLKSCGAFQQLRELHYPKCGILCCSVEQRSSVLNSCF